MKGKLSILALVACLPAVALGDWTGTVLDGHADAIPGFTGHTDFDATSGANVMDVHVDYAVFAPGVQPSGATPFPAAGEYVYAYQIYNVDSGHGGQSNVYVSALSINLDGGVVTPPLFDDPPWDSGVRPSYFTLITGLEARYDFLYLPDPPPYLLYPGDYSSILLLSSPEPPTFRPATVYDSGIGTLPNGPLPVPVPAPGAALLGVIGLGVVGRVKRYLG